MSEVGFAFYAQLFFSVSRVFLYVTHVGSKMSTGGEVANALVCKTSIRGFNSRPVLQIFLNPLRS
jgi:hypothetical protein